MPLLDANNQPLRQSGSGGTLQLAAIPTGADLYSAVWNYLAGALAQWVAAGFVDFTSPTVFVGTAVGGTLFPAGAQTYMRLHFNGLQVDLQFGAPDDGVPFFVFAHYSFTSSPLLNAYANFADLLELVFRTLDALYFSGVPVVFAGVSAGYPGGDAMSTGDTVKLIVQIQQFDADPLQIAHHFRAANSGATFDNLESEYRTAALTPLANLLHQSCAIVAVKVEDRINVLAPTIQRKTRTYNSAGTYPVAGAVVAGGATGGEAPQLAACITWESPFAGRGERGRTFLPGMADNASEGGLLTDAYKVLAQAYVDALVNNFGVDLANVPNNPANNWIFVLWREHLTNPALPSGNTNPAGAVARTTANPSGYAFPPATKPPFNPRAAANGVQAGIVRDVVRTQRRRGRGVRIGRRRTIA